ncbi:MAG TPA: MFS transporter [Burkholderiales bacterium]|jgi:EmrB/QacA subfamily drug resistance transporter|nr:MFS transporter [Burkholderiales bacterium]
MSNHAAVEPERQAERPAETVSRAEFLNLFGAVFLPMFMAAVDQTLLATATPAIAASLGGLRDTSWIAVGYLLASATIVPVYGRLGDRRGRRDVLLVALGVFTLGSLACGLAQTLPQLVAARILQGLGGGGLMTLSQALIGELVPPRERARFQAYFALVFTAASVTGPVVGGLVVSHASWRWLFFANLPIAVFAAWRLARLPKGEKHPPAARGADLPGHVLFAVGALATLFWLTSGGHRFAWGSAPSLALLATGVVALGLLWRQERRHPAPFLPVELMRERTVALSVVVVGLFASCLFSVVFFLPVYLQLGHEMSAQASGLLLLPVTAGMVVASTTSSRILARTGRPHWIPVTGLSLSSAALFALALVPSDTTLIGCLAFITGLGFGCVMPTTNVTLQMVAGRQRLGVVTALMALARSTGGAAGAALFGAVAFALMPAAAHGRSVMSAFHAGFLLFAVVAAAAAFAASRIPPLKLWDRE